MKICWVGLLVALTAIACSGGNPASVAFPTPVVPPTPTRTAMVPTPSASPTPTQAVTARQPAPTPAPSPPPGPAPLKELDVERAFPGLSFARMVVLTYPDDGSNRLFLVLQPGRIMVFPNDPAVTSASTFLDIRDQVSDRGNEEGLLGLAFDPGFSDNGYFYVYYSASGPRRSVISRFSVSPDNSDLADPDSERIIMEVQQPHSNHNGGQLVFGPDRFLYISLGDGGSRGDPDENGQDLSTLLGAILRIDVSTLDSTGSYSIPPDNPFVGVDGAKQEIWAYGLRNPWRFTFDRLTGDMWAGDVGQNRFEEVDIIRPGLNYGWNVMEGFSCFQPPSGCDQRGLEPPVADYGRDEGCSVTGGYVYRNSRIPSLYGAYVYGDFCSGRIWALRHDGEQVTEHMEIIDSDLRISSFGEDQTGEMYILSFDERIYRLAQK